MNHAKKCQTIYKKKGQDGVFEYAGKHPEIPWRFCEPCGIESPIFEGSCLVCSTLNPEKTYIEKLFDNVNGGDCADSAAILEEIVEVLFDVVKEIQKEAFQFDDEAKQPFNRGNWTIHPRTMQQVRIAVLKAEGKI